MTSAARQFDAWLEAANSTKLGALAEWLEKNYPSLQNKGHLAAEVGAMRTGGLELRQIEEDTETGFVGVVQERSQEQFKRVVLEVEAIEPFFITRLEVKAIPPPPGLEIRRMTEADALAAFGDHLDERTALGTFSGAVLVAKDGATIFSGAYGFQDQERAVANTIHTPFPIASLTKAFTAVAVLQLDRQGALSLTEPIGTYLPDYPDKDAAARITPHHLLTHTSGVSAQLGLGPDLHLETLEDHMATFGTLGLDFEPGSRWGYSNFGYILLGLIVERVSKQPYPEYVGEHVFEPVEMRSSGYASPHPRAPAGGAYSTVEDVKRFGEALMDHRLLDAAHFKLLTTGEVERGGVGGRQGHGFEEFVVDGVRWICRTGGTNQVNSELRIYPDSGYTVIVLGNVRVPLAWHMAAFIGNRLPVG